MKTVDAEFVDEVIVTCSECGQKNRLYKRAQLGTHRCGSCRTPLSDPFNPIKAGGGGWTIFAWVSVGAVILLIIVAIAHNTSQTEPRSYSDSTGYQPPTVPPPISATEERPTTLPAQPSSNTSFNAAQTPASRPTTELQRNSDGSFSLPASALTEDARRAIAALKQRGSQVDAESVASEIARAKANQAPAVPAPANGEMRTYTDQTGVAPFEIKSTRGTNYLVKLATISGQPVLTVFVRGGETVNVNVPLGTYVVKYASGDTWYGYDALFGPNTGYSKASTYFTFQNTTTEIQGYTITLYKVPFGNLHTERIKPNEF